MPKKVVAKTDDIVFDKSKLSIVPINEVRPNTWNPKEADTIEYQRIKLGIQQHGLRKPIIVRENDGYEIIDGEQRWTICKELGYKKIPIYNEGELSDKEARELTIIYEHQVPFEPINFMVLIKELDDMYDDIEVGYSDIEITDILGVLSTDEGEQSPDGLWNDMPEFEQEDDLPYQTIRLHFVSSKDVEEFADLIGRTITPQTKYLHIPKRTEADQAYSQKIAYVEDE